MTLDDEHTNQAKDSRDYSERVKALFREYLKQHSTLAYLDPVDIVQNKSKRQALYRLWVDFKCSRNLYLYTLYRQAHLEGLKEAKGANASSKPLLVAVILKNKTPEESKVNSYWDYRKLAEHCDFISPMIYTYQGTKDSAVVGDVVEMYHNYIGKTVVGPTLDCGQGNIDSETLIPNKPKFKYEIMECLMQQARLIMFWHGPAMLDPINLQHISEAIRWAGPYEDIILNGQRYDGAISPEKWVRIKGLQLGRRVLLYVANYRNAVARTAAINVPTQLAAVLEIGPGKRVPVQNSAFSVDFTSDRGKLFLLTLAE